MGLVFPLAGSARWDEQQPQCPPRPARLHEPGTLLHGPAALAYPFFGFSAAVLPAALPALALPSEPGALRSRQRSILPGQPSAPAPTTPVAAEATAGGGGRAGNPTPTPGSVSVVKP